MKLTVLSLFQNGLERCVQDLTQDLEVVRLKSTEVRRFTARCVSPPLKVVCVFPPVG